MIVSILFSFLAFSHFFFLVFTWEKFASLTGALFETTSESTVVLYSGHWDLLSNSHILESGTQRGLIKTQHP